MNFDWVVSNANQIWSLTLTHIWLTLLPTAIGLLIAVPLGYVAHHWRRAYLPIVGGTSLFFTLPSLALFILLPQFLGTRILDPINVVVALVIYSVALLTRVVADGLSAVPTESVQAAEGMGFKRSETFFKVQLPIAVPAILSGLRVVVVTNISITTMAAIIGVEQLGTLFTLGFTRNLLVPIVTGLVICLLLALLLDRLLVLLGRILTPWARKGAL
ncbi:glycine/betaine ABC transporter permease [Leucobacter sp. Psy1]|uniref:ABC transporter permease n=1 Tax=Leucobacter sp. Psy1 TaxID=2875729 RepID=UPI001CD28C9E|nr:ABC transporter permease subunit [Leucobacter sp. Psy1]UBH05930.1 glycine/betaine ABC transporter permease [Leucobacter sp. Psy1]